MCFLKKHKFKRLLPYPFGFTLGNLLIRRVRCMNCNIIYGVCFRRDKPTSVDLSFTKRTIIKFD